MKIHPLAELFPPLEPAELQSLADDIKANGLRDPILLHDGQILDGRNRFAACEMTGVKASFNASLTPRKIVAGRAEILRWDCPVCSADNLGHKPGAVCPQCRAVTWIELIADPLALVLSRNLYRRHLTTSQRAMVADKLATLGRGGDHTNTEISVLTQPQAAAALNISTDAVQQARQVREHGAPELVKAVERGDIAVSTAAKVAKVVPKAEQAQVVIGGKAEVLKVVKAAAAVPKPKAMEPPTAKPRTRRSRVDDLLPHMHRIAGTTMTGPTELERLLALPPEERERLIVDAESGKPVSVPFNAEARVSLSASEMKRLLMALSDHSVRMAAAMMKEVLGDRLGRFQCLLDGFYYQGGFQEFIYALCDEEPEHEQHEDDDADWSAEAA